MTEQNIAILVAVNLVAFGLFRFDKKQAQSGGWRIPERTLWLSCGTGGVLGAWLAVVSLRHKTRKPVFLLVLTLASAAGIVFWSWLIG